MGCGYGLRCSAKVLISVPMLSCPEAMSADSSTRWWSEMAEAVSGSLLSLGWEGEEGLLRHGNSWVFFPLFTVSVHNAFSYNKW